MKKIPVIEKIAVVLFGLFLCIVILEIGLRIGSLIFLSLQECRNQISIRQRVSYRILCLGESTTAGYGSSYTTYLQQILNQQNLGIKFSVINKGISGTNASAICSNLEYNLNRYNPDMVITMMGINDRSGIFVSEDRRPFKKIVFFLKDFRIYKLTKLLCLRTINKVKEMGIYKQRKKRNMPASIYNQKQLSKHNITEEAGYKMKYSYLVRLYIEHGKHNELIELLEKSLKMNRNNDEVYIELGWLYRHQKDYNKSKEILEKAIEVNPKNSQAYIELGYWYMGKWEDDKVEKMFKKAIDVDPNNSQAYIELGWWYKKQRNYSKAIETFKKSIDVSPKDDKTYRGLIACYKELREYKSEEIYSKKAELLRIKYYNSMTYNNYNRLREIVTKRGIKLVCMQYPARSVEPLKKLFNDTEGIVFVDNEEVFKKALRGVNYKKYFLDMFGGDFGHCTEKGNKLLAENIADTISKEYFNKRIK